MKADIQNIVNKFLYRLMCFDYDRVILCFSTFLKCWSCSRSESAANWSCFHRHRFNFDDLKCNLSIVSGITIFCMVCVLACGSKI